ncbi:type III-B CRISPR module RAMP protein Cmr4 [Desulfitobacterium chlororespirans]|uniref:CRISPR-associated protein Cmr4 n=1 Tax=Desulfitobacterium chlororespirans DSM 11544 TaxID=1121395 RepID=A0A1M7TS22_9FIRM|nr:type III-B CRISPR module RAMP protein Cmr4 [Desulfitobacterium chlororespirans]SHN73515.1 CRISPR-associated protein Cmr4 [Desulfitobacterium chlororespirans DSM 11544]
MYKLAKPLGLICETPLHVGCGNDLGVVDLPIQREKHTGFPKVEASGLKGALREAFEGLEEVSFKGTFFRDRVERERCINLSFGPEKGDLYAGALGFTDARLLLFPIKSMKGIFAWITCPFILERLKKDLERCGLKPEFGLPPENSTPKESGLFVKDNKIVLEEFTFEIEHPDNEHCTELIRWISNNLVPQNDEYAYWRKKLAASLVVLSDSDFTDFVKISTEVATRTKINAKTGTVENGALFTEEYLPAETLLYTLALSTPVFSSEKSPFTAQGIGAGEKSVMEYFITNLPGVIQLGGNATLGKGLVRLKVVEA